MLYYDETKLAGFNLAHPVESTSVLCSCDLTPNFLSVSPTYGLGLITVGRCDVVHTLRYLFFVLFIRSSACRTGWRWLHVAPINVKFGTGEDLSPYQIRQGRADHPPLTAEFAAEFLSAENPPKKNGYSNNKVKSTPQ